MEVSSPLRPTAGENDALRSPAEYLKGICAKRIELNDLPLWCAYTSRMLSGEPLEPIDRRAEAVMKTYEQHYARCLEYVDRCSPRATIEDVRRYQNEMTAGVGRHGSQEDNTDEHHPICVSLGDELYELDDAREQEINTRIMVDALSSVVDGCDTIVELGAGYGYGLSRLSPHFADKKLCGADGPSNAVAIAQRVFVRQYNAKFHQFNLTDPDSYGFLEEGQAPLVVYTRHTVEQVDSSEVILNALKRYRDRIHAVVHFEPLYLPEDCSTLGILRRRYLEYQGYNIDLVSQIEGTPNIELMRKQINVIGRNPLLPISVLIWRFV